MVQSSSRGWLRSGWRRLAAIGHELQLDARLRALGRRESRVLLRLGEAAEAAGVGPGDEGRALLAHLRERRLELDRMAAALVASREADRADLAGVSAWMQPLVLVRGISGRLILRHRIRGLRRSLAGPLENLGRVAVANALGKARLDVSLVAAVDRVRSDAAAVREERGCRLSGYGGTALPGWFPHLGDESKALGKALWLQLRPNVLPRFPALAGLLVGWWIANTYTDSHLRSTLRSLGIGHGGSRVISGDTYRAMLFWLPILAAGLCAYVADRAKLMLARRYSSHPERSDGARP